MKRIFTLTLVFLLIFTAASCSKKKEEEISGYKEEVSKEIAAEEGGSVKSSDESIAIDIPGGALEGNTTITMKVYDASGYTGTEGKKVVSKVVEFEPSGTIFKKPVLITMKSAEAVENKIITAAVLNEETGEWSYSESGAAVMIAGKDAAGDPIMTTAAGDPIMLNAAGDPIMTSAAGDPIMLSAAGDPIMVTAAGDPIMMSAAGDPIMMTTGHFTSYTFIAIEKDTEEPDDADEEDDGDKDDADEDGEISDEDTYVPKCGNGIVDEGEECDNGAAGNELRGPEAACRPDCTLVRCGDSIVDEGEECDNGELNGQTDCVYGETGCTLCTADCRIIEGAVSIVVNKNWTEVEV